MPRRPVGLFATLLATLACGAAAQNSAPSSTPTPDQVAAALTRANQLGNKSPDFTPTLQSVAAGFPRVETSTTPGQPAWQRVTLNAKGHRVDALRFRTPPAPSADVTPKPKPADFNWVFAFPKDSVQTWYICPAAPGAKMQGFQNFFPLKREELKNLEAPAEHKVVAQRLAASRLKPDTEYLLWFTFANEQPADVRLAITLAPSGSDQKAVLQTLGVTP